MLDFNNSLIVEALFLVFIACEDGVKFLVMWLFAKELKTLTSKNACCPLCQKPRALTSSLASSEDLGLCSIHQVTMSPELCHKERNYVLSL